MNWFRGYLSVALDDGAGKDSVTIFDVQNKVNLKNKYLKERSEISEYFVLYSVHLKNKYLKERSEI